VIPFHVVIFHLTLFFFLFLFFFFFGHEVEILRTFAFFISIEIPGGLEISAFNFLSGVRIGVDSISLGMIVPFSFSLGVVVVCDEIV